MTNELGITNVKSVHNFNWKKIYVQNSQLVSQTTDISAFHSKLTSHRLVLKVLSVWKKHCL